MSKTLKSLLKSLYATFGIFIFLFVIFHISGALYTSSLADRAAVSFQAGITQDLAYLKNQGDIVAKNELLIKYLLAGDLDNLMSTIQLEKTARSIGLMGVTNDEGIIQARTKTSSKKGDNIFLTTVVGRAVGQGKSVESVEATVGFDPRQIYLVTGRPIMSEGQMIGSLYANYLTDDNYATRFRDTYLARGEQIVFYNKEAGTYGNSFSDPETKKLINSYFNSGSDWIQKGLSDQTILFKNNEFYLVKNIIFPGLEKNPGGALLFIPRLDLSTVLNFLITFLTLCAFVCFALNHHLNYSKREERGWRYYLTLALVSIPVIILASFAIHIQNMSYLQLTRIPYTPYNSTLRLQPEFSVYDTNFEQRVSVVVDTGDEVINAVQIGLLFDPEKVDVTAIETSSSTCSYVLENNIDTESGQANLACVLLKTDGGSGSITLADIILTPKKVGDFTLSFSKEDTKVLAHDGLATNVLRMSQSGHYQVNNFNAATSTAKSIVVFSSTHPNQSRWYNSQNVHLLWGGKPTDIYSYALDTHPDTIPAKDRTIQGQSLDITIPSDGIFYFHLQSILGGPISHYRLQIDRTPPIITSMEINADKVLAGDVVRFTFQAEDPASGVQNNYYVDVGNHLFLPIGSQLFIPFFTPGDENVILRVYDSANNYSEKNILIHVESR